jgi:hypothetical protein
MMKSGRVLSVSRSSKLFIDKAQPNPSTLTWSLRCQNDNFGAVRLQKIITPRVSERFSTIMSKSSRSSHSMMVTRLTTKPCLRP